MKNLAGLIGLFLLLAFTSCGHIPAQRVEVVNTEKIPVGTRASRYYSCIKELNREGIKQSLLKDLCNATFGGIE